MAQQLQQVGGVSKPAKVDGNRRMSVMPAAPTATQVAARSDQLSKLITTCLAEEPQPALISTIVDQTAKKISVVQPTSGSQVTGTITRTADNDGNDWATPRVSISVRPRPQPALNEVVVKAAWFG